MSLYIDICTPFKKGQQNGLMVLSCCSVQGRVADPINLSGSLLYQDIKDTLSMASFSMGSKMKRYVTFSISGSTISFNMWWLLKKRFFVVVNYTFEAYGPSSLPASNSSSISSSSA